MNMYDKDGNAVRVDKDQVAVMKKAGLTVQKSSEKEESKPAAQSAAK